MFCRRCGHDVAPDDQFCSGCGARDPVSSRGATPTTRRSGAREASTAEIVDAKYKITGLLGRGGMGEVLRAVEIVTGREVAIKRLNSEISTEPGVRERFLDEARALGRLNHPNIVTFYNFVEDGNRFHIVMELVEGPTLQERIQAEGALPSSEAARIARVVCDALAHSHARGVLHRDVKPANILLGVDGRIRVTDFGIARVAGGSHLTSTGAAVGTAWYMSPEQVLGRSVDERADIYSLGVTLYESLAGRVPFGGDSDFEVRRAHVEKPPPKLPSTVSGSLDRVVARSLEKDPARRFPSAHEMGCALEPGLADEALSKLGVSHAGPTPAPSPAPPVADRGGVRIEKHDGFTVRIVGSGAGKAAAPVVPSAPAGDDEARQRIREWRARGLGRFEIVSRLVHQHGLPLGQAGLLAEQEDRAAKGG